MSSIIITAHLMVMLILPLGPLLFLQPPDWIRTWWIRSRFRLLASIETFQPEVESGKRTQETAKLLPTILVAIHDNRWSVVTLRYPAVDSGAINIKSIFPGSVAGEIRRAQIALSQTGLDLFE